MTDNNFDDIAVFLKAVPKDMELGKRYEWECPVCGGVVEGTQNKGNNHLHASCESCGMAISQ